MYMYMYMCVYNIYPDSADASLSCRSTHAAPIAGFSESHVTPSPDLCQGGNRPITIAKPTI